MTHLGYDFALDNLGLEPNIEYAVAIKIAKKKRLEECLYTCIRRGWKASFKRLWKTFAFDVERHTCLPGVGLAKLNEMLE